MSRARVQYHASNASIWDVRIGKRLVQHDNPNVSHTCRSVYEMHSVRLSSLQSTSTKRVNPNKKANPTRRGACETLCKVKWMSTSIRNQTMFRLTKAPHKSRDCSQYYRMLSKCITVFKTYNGINMHCHQHVSLDSQPTRQESSCSTVATFRFLEAAAKPLRKSRKSNVVLSFLFEAGRFKTFSFLNHVYLRWRHIARCAVPNRDTTAYIVRDRSGHACLPFC